MGPQVHRVHRPHAARFSAYSGGLFPRHVQLATSFQLLEDTIVEVAHPRPLNTAFQAAMGYHTRQSAPPHIPVDLCFFRSTLVLSQITCPACCLNKFIWPVCLMSRTLEL